MSPAVFRLTSDRYFIKASEGRDDDLDIIVYEYQYDPYEMNIMLPADLRHDNEWGPSYRIGPSERAEFKALEVFGVVIISGSTRRWMSLLRDLKLELGPPNSPTWTTVHLIVNRVGLSFVPKVRRSTVSMLRINDYFGWSKYGVKLPECTTANVWNRCDIRSGATVLDVRGIMIETEVVKDEVNVLRREVEKRELELAVCGKELECTKEIVERSKEKEMLLNRLVEEKEREVEEVNHQLLAFKAALGALLSQVEQEY